MSTSITSDSRPRCSVIFPRRAMVWLISTTSCLFARRFEEALPAAAGQRVPEPGILHQITIMFVVFINSRRILRMLPS